RRKAISGARSQRRRQLHEEQAASEWFARANQQQANAEIAAEALAELSVEDREIVIAHLWGRLTFNEVTQLVGTSTSSAQRRFEAAIERLREKLNPNHLQLPCPRNRL